MLFPCLTTIVWANLSSGSQQSNNILSFIFASNSIYRKGEQVRAKHTMISTIFDASDDVKLDEAMPTMKYIKRKIALPVQQESIISQVTAHLYRELAEIEKGVLTIEPSLSHCKLFFGQPKLLNEGVTGRQKLFLGISKGTLEVEKQEDIFCVDKDVDTSKALRFSITIFGEERKGQRHQGAKHVVNDFREPDEFSEMREEAINQELKKIGIDYEDLFKDEFIGTPPLRTYRTFIRPRQKKLKKVKKEPIERAAARTAHQIAFLMRHHQATQADFFRNNDIVVDDAQKERMKVHPIKIILDNLRSAYNVGSIFRTSETAGVEEVLTCGITPSSSHPKITKTACSATQNVKSRHFMNTKEAVVNLQAEGYKVYAMETTAHSNLYTNVNFPHKTALVLGNEVTGVDISVLNICDSLIEIPTFGMKNSLNVASACPIVVYEVIRQWSI